MNEPVSWLNDGSEKSILPLVWVLGAARQDDIDVIAVVLRIADLPLAARFLPSRHLVLRNAEVHPDRVDGGDVGEVRAFGRRVDESTLALQRPARQAGHRRADRRVAQIEPRLLDLGQGAEHGGTGRVEVALGIVEVGLRQRVLLGQRLDTFEVGFGRGQARLLRLQLALRRVELRVEGLGVEDE